MAADAELRRRHPGRKIEPLRSAEPAPASDSGCDPSQPTVDGEFTETAALIRELAMQREEFRAEMDERPQLTVPGQDHGKAFGAMKMPGQDAILLPPKLEILPSARILQLAAEHEIEPEAGGLPLLIARRRRRVNRIHTVSLGTLWRCLYPPPADAATCEDLDGLPVGDRDQPRRLIRSHVAGMSDRASRRRLPPT